jgi:rare lipoprotein A (peptidoglycan hydrolase)
MKRVMPALLALLFVATLSAQDRPVGMLRGNATQEMQAGGLSAALSAAYSSIPIGSKVRVTNPANGLDIEVTIIDRIPESPRRIIDLSPGVAVYLDLGPGGGPVLLTPTIIAQSDQSASEVKGEMSPETEAALEKLKQPVNITYINNYNMNPDNPMSVQQAMSASQTPAEGNQERPTRRNRGQQAGIDPYNYGEESYKNPYVAEQPARQPTQPSQPSQPSQPTQPAAPPPLYTSPSAYDPQFFPNPLPDPHSNKSYRLLVGTYQGLENAFHVEMQLRVAGFSVYPEQAGDMCRLYADKIPASMVYYAIQRLWAIGFEKIRIQECQD